MGLALVVAAFTLYLAFDRGRTDEPVVRQGAVVRVFPQPDAVALRQDAIGVELAFGYRASLQIDGRPIPDDQLDTVEGINRVSFTPGEGKEIEQLEAGRHCATVRYFAATSATPGAGEDDAQPFTWCFRVA